MRFRVWIPALAGAVCIFTASGGTHPQDIHAASREAYVATLHPMNSKVTGREAAGEARFDVTGETLAIHVSVRGVPANLEHWQHVHGFTDNRKATCPTEAADVNHDGIIDITETEPVSGTTMVPFNRDPAAMQVASDTYPKASSDGTFRYDHTVALKTLQAAFAKAFHGQSLDLDRRVVFIHGVAPTSKLPTSAASLGTIPVHVTLPIACGVIERMSK